jgi:hypothetical protein
MRCSNAQTDLQYSTRQLFCLEIYLSDSSTLRPQVARLCSRLGPSLPRSSTSAGLESGSCHRTGRTGSTFIGVSASTVDCPLKPLSAARSSNHLPVSAFWTAAGCLSIYLFNLLVHSPFRRDSDLSRPCLDGSIFWLLR